MIKTRKQDIFLGCLLGVLLQPLPCLHPYQYPPSHILRPFSRLELTLPATIWRSISQGLGLASSVPQSGHAPRNISAAWGEECKCLAKGEEGITELFCCRVNRSSEVPVSLWWPEAASVTRCLLFWCLHMTSKLSCSVALSYLFDHWIAWVLFFFLIDVANY